MQHHQDNNNREAVHAKGAQTSHLARNYLHIRHLQFSSRLLLLILLLASLLGMLLTGYASLALWQAWQKNQRLGLSQSAQQASKAVATQTPVATQNKHTPLPQTAQSKWHGYHLSERDPLLAYHLGLEMQQQQRFQAASQAFGIVAASHQAQLARAGKFALANLHFDLFMLARNRPGDALHQQAVAHVILAREAYKAVLRKNPDFFPARYNLELLDRLSPEKRTQAWQSETDGVTLQPFKRNGTAMMRDNRRRGLP